VSAAAVIRAAFGGASRRVVQSVVVFGVLAVASAAALMGLALYATARVGFYGGCAVTHCAQLAVTIDSAKVTAEQVAKTRRLPGVTAAAGPYPQTTITVTAAGPGGGGSAGPQAKAGRPAWAGAAAGVAVPVTPGSHASHGLPSQQLTVVGRSSPSGRLDDVVANPPIMDAITHGHSQWPVHPDEISLAIDSAIRVPLGGALTVTSAPGKPKLTVVGYGDQQVSYEDAWVAPSEIPVLRPAGAPAQEQVLYTFADAANASQIDADLAELKRALPPGAIASSQSWLTALEVNSGPNINTPFVLAFSILALVLAVLITANVVSAAVLASYRRIGVLKSIGFTPAQVTATYLVQIGLPALAGAIVGTLLGNRWVLPLIDVYPIQGERVSVPLWINLTVPLGMCALTGVAAAVPALRAGRLSTVAAIAAGQAPPAGRGYASHRLAARIPLPRPLTIGLAAPFSRPARSLVTLLALTFGLAAVVLAASLNASLHKINHSARSGLGQLTAGYRCGHQCTLSASQSSHVLAALHEQPSTLHYLAESDLIGHPSGAHGPTLRIGTTFPIFASGHKQLSLFVYAYDGDSSWLGWNLISGHWYHGPHELDASLALLAATGLKVGDQITLSVKDKPVTARIAGEVFTPTGLPTLYTSWQTLGGAAAGLAPSHYDIALKHGTSTQHYTNALTHQLGAGYYVAQPAGPSGAGQVDTSLFQLLALLVAVLAALGVLNSVLMATRERLHDLGIYKALGMTPAQTLAMVICWVIAPTLIAAAIGLPIGLILQDNLVRHLSATFEKTLPGNFVHVLGVLDLTLLSLAGLGIAIAGALGPAGWAAASRTTTALRAE
jgi:putative ABC transport system permease protein